MRGEPPDPRVDLALRRTEWALERTQLAWVRTAFVIISAGLTLNKGFQALSEARLLEGSQWVLGGHVGGVLLSASASTLLALATIGYIRRARELGWSSGWQVPVTSVLTLSTLVVLLGATVAGLLLVWG